VHGVAKKKNNSKQQQTTTAKTTTNKKYKITRMLHNYSITLFFLLQILSV
jgi:hypothetical protein